MAKKPQGTDNKVKAEDVILMPPTKLVVSLAKNREDVKTENSERSGEFGFAINEAKQKKHLDKKAHAMACQLRALSDRQLAITLPHLLRYIDDLGLTERAQKQAELFENEAEVHASESGNDDGKVTPIGQAARKVAEQAGEGAR